jgi:hypothetical protein
MQHMSTVMIAVCLCTYRTSHFFELSPWIRGYMIVAATRVQITSISFG